MRRAADPAARLERLRGARKRLKRGELFNADEMAGVAGMTWRNMKPMVEADANWPVLRRGSEGVAWQFEGRAVLDHMIAALEVAQRERDARAARVAKMTGITVEQAQSGLSVSDLAKIDQLQTSAQRRKIEQREWVRRDEAESVITGVFTTIQSETLATVSRLDAAGRWPANVRAEVADEMRSYLVRLHDQVAGWLTPDAGPKSKPRIRANRARK
jgi:hypothetical protein